MLKAGAELGFSPSSRTRVQIAPDLRNNRFARFRRDPFNPRPKPWEFGELDDPDGLLAMPWDNDGPEEEDPAERYLR